MLVLKCQTPFHSLLHKKFGGGVKKIKMCRFTSYQECIFAICRAFNFEPNSDMFLIDTNNNKVKEDGFTIGTYVKGYTYVGATRIYCVAQITDTCRYAADDTVVSSHVGTEFTPGHSPPVLTPQKPSTCTITPEVATSPCSSTCTITSEVDEVAVSPCPSASTTIISSEIQVSPAELMNNISSDIVSPSEFISSVDFLSMEEVNKYLLGEVLEERALPTEAEMQTERPAGTAPVSTRNAGVLFYMDLKEKVYHKIQMGNGKFVHLSNSDFEEFLMFRAQLNIEDLEIVNPPLLYFMGTKNIKGQKMSKHVVTLDEIVRSEYRQWRENLKDQILRSLGDN